MSEQNRYINWPYDITRKSTKKNADLSIPVVAPALARIGVSGNLQVALRHPQNTGPSREMVQDFARKLLDKLAFEKVFTVEQAARAFEDF